MDFIETLLVACIPAIISGIISFLLAKSKAKIDTENLVISNQHEIERLMEQHKIDIDAIREQHRLEMDAKEKEHQHNLEIMQKEHENELIRQEKETENAVKYSVMGDVFTGLFGEIMTSSEIKDMLSKTIMNGIADNSTSKNNPIK
ncbi:MAG: hypothetical protein UDG94_03970 [Peptococcaceae bacterium]|nr:hypothetical protein [Peptococcaceae bacterium]